MTGWPDKAEGRKEIARALDCSWRTIQRHKKADPGLKKLFRINHTNGKPFIFLSEYRAYLFEVNKNLQN